MNQLSPYAAFFMRLAVGGVFLRHGLVKVHNGIPALAAARAPAISPSVCINRVKPVGAIANGSATGPPSTAQPVATLLTSRRIVG